MTESNGGILSTGDRRVDAALKRIQERNEARFIEIEDSMTVQAFLEQRWSKQIAGHAQWLDEQQESIARHDKWVKDIELTLSEMAEKVNLLFDHEMKREGGPEAR